MPSPGKYGEYHGINQFTKVLNYYGKVTATLGNMKVPKHTFAPGLTMENRPNELAPNTDEAVYLLGKTGSTVVYVFPTGKAVAQRQDKSKTQKLEVVSPHANNDQVLIELLMEKLMAAGVISAIQKEVALYDHRTSGMPLVDILVARGWTTEDTIKPFLQGL